jgi:hypothetical protein
MDNNLKKGGENGQDRITGGFRLVDCQCFIGMVKSINAMIK